MEVQDEKIMISEEPADIDIELSLNETSKINEDRAKHQEDNSGIISSNPACDGVFNEGEVCPG